MMLLPTTIFRTPSRGAWKADFAAKTRRSPRKSQIENSKCSSSPSRSSAPASVVEPRLRGFTSFKSAFSFIEVLFAVILLGIGFIMIAGVFPAAIQQTAAVSDETAGDAIVRDAIKKIQAVADSEVNGTLTVPGENVNQANTLFQPTLRLEASPNPSVPVVAGFSYGLNQALGTDAFFTADHRYAWVGFYRRASLTSPFAQVFIIALKNPNFANYTTTYQPGEAMAWSPVPPILPSVAPPIPPLLYNYKNSFATNPPAPPTGAAALVPVYSLNAFIDNQIDNPPPPINSIGATVTLQYNTTTQTSSVMFNINSGTIAAATGCFLLVLDDGTTYSTASTALAAPILTGRVLRLGAMTAQTATSETFALQPDWDLSPTDLANLGNPNLNNNASASSGTTAQVDVVLIGRAPLLTAGTEYTGAFTGPPQDIAAGSGFIRVNTINN